MDNLGPEPMDNPIIRAILSRVQAALGWGYMKLIAQAEMNPVPPVGGIQNYG